jgi:uncharacterized protein YijF (DUF1287 family)
MSPDTGVCTGEVIRVYRTLGIDVQKEVHEDLLADFAGVSESEALATGTCRFQY